MNQLIQALDGVALGIGVKTGFQVSAGTGLAINTAWGIAQVGTVTNDASVTNVSARGYNQPGKLVEKLATITAATLAASVTQILWLQPDGTFILTADTVTGDFYDVCPKFGPDPYVGALITNLQEGSLRKAPMAALPLARVVSGATTITSVDNTIAPRL